MTPPDDVSTRLSEIRERVEAATEGPWRAEDDPDALMYDVTISDRVPLNEDFRGAIATLSQTNQIPKTEQLDNAEFPDQDAYEKWVEAEKERVRRELDRRLDDIAEEVMPTENKVDDIEERLVVCGCGAILHDPAGHDCDSDVWTWAPRPQTPSGLYSVLCTIANHQQEGDSART